MSATTSYPLHALLLAETRMAEVSLQYREESAHINKSEFWWLLLPLIAVGIGLAIYKWWDRAPAVVNTPCGMLNELCRAHHLGRQECRMMEKIAEAAELEQPATMFLGRNQFEAAVKVARQRIKFDRRQTATLCVLRRRLFA